MGIAYKVNTFLYLYSILFKICGFRMPKERRHFSSCIVDDKLFIIGGTGRFRIKLNDDMFYFDLKTSK